MKFVHQLYHHEVLLYCCTNFTQVFKEHNTAQEDHVMVYRESDKWKVYISNSVTNHDVHPKFDRVRVVELVTLCSGERMISCNCGYVHTFCLPCRHILAVTRKFHVSMCHPRWQKQFFQKMFRDHTYTRNVCELRFLLSNNLGCVVLSNVEEWIFLSSEKRDVFVRMYL